MINPTIKAAIDAALSTYTVYEPVNAPVIADKLKTVFGLEEDFLAKADALDEVFDEHPEVDDLREVFFDLLMVNFFSADIDRLEEDYLDSPEWAEIEEETLDRGTELLNLLLYLNECNDEDLEPSLDDYLTEFLLVDDDEFQDEHQIYEPIIANQILVESSPKEVNKVAQRLSEDAELKQLFYPIMTFFQNTQPGESDQQDVAEQAPDKAFDMAVYNVLLAFNKN